MFPDVYLTQAYVQDRHHEIALTRMAEAGTTPHQPHQHWWAHLRHHAPTPVLTPSPRPV